MGDPVLGTWGLGANLQIKVRPEPTPARPGGGDAVHCGCTAVGGPKPRGLRPSFRFSREPSGRNSCRPPWSPGPQCGWQSRTYAQAPPSAAPAQRGRGPGTLTTPSAAETGGPGLPSRPISPRPRSSPCLVRRKVCRATDTGWDTCRSTRLKRLQEEASICRWEKICLVSVTRSQARGEHDRDSQTTSQLQLFPGRRASARASLVVQGLRNHLPRQDAGSIPPWSKKDPTCHGATKAI